MASGVRGASTERARQDADSGEGSSRSGATSMTISTSASTSLPATPSGMGTPASPLFTPPAGKASFQGSELDYERGWARTALLSPSRCSSQFFDDGPSPYSVADLEAPRPQYARSFSDTSSMMSSKFSLFPDPSTWGSAINTNIPEPDDELHTPDPRRDTTVDKGGTLCTSRGVLNLGCLILLGTMLFGLFAGFPLAYHFTRRPASKSTGYNIDKTNSTGQVPVNRALQSDFDDLGR